MSTPSGDFDKKKVRLALARHAYETGKVRIVHDDLSDYDCLASSRRGLYACSRTDVRLVAHGICFGMAFHEGYIYLFESCDRPSSLSRMGRIVRFRFDDRRLADPHVLVTGIDNACHEIAVIDGVLCVVDTFNQAICRFTLDGAVIDVRTPFPVAPPDDSSGAYLHLNSIKKVGDRVGLVLHNGPARPHKQSEFALLGEDWNVVERVSLQGRGCHNILVRDDGPLLFCGSLDGEVIDLDGKRVKVSAMMTRGLVTRGSSIIVGASGLAPRGIRDDAAGRLYFCDRELRVEAEIAMPAAPMDLLAL